MSDVLERLKQDYEHFRALLGRVRSQQVNQGKTRDSARSLATSYFGEYRLGFLKMGIGDDLLENIDSCIEALLRFSQRRSLTRRYRRVSRELRSVLNDLEVECLAKGTTPRTEAGAITEIDRSIVDTLSRLCPPAAASYEQGLLDLQDKERLSWRGPATEFREALRETLDSLTPVAAADDGSSSDTADKIEKPTMKERVVAILKSRKAKKGAIATSKRSIDLIEEMTGALVRSVYNRASASTHGTVTRGEVETIKGYVSLVLSELLEVR